jgi:3-dehydroquinate synthase
MAIPVSTLSAPTYPLHIGESAFGELEAFLRKQKFSSVFILVDENTLQHCLPQLVGRVKSLANAEIVELESGERNKTIEVCTQVWQVLGELGADRKSLLINLGGGVITDMGGFIASTFKRGIAFVNVPTTLLSQIDASVGGKTGVDLNGLKNEIGVFADPQQVIIVPDFLRTLPRREMLSGFAEALKHGLICDRNFWESLLEVNIGDSADWEEVILRSIRIKLEIVTEDPQESGKRRLLNFGHTIGHALESFFLEQAESSLLHGEAVAAGMVAEAFLSSQLAGLPQEELEQITTSLLLRFGAVTIDPMADHRLVELMRNDKKNESGQIRFVLLESIGTAVYDKKVNARQVIEALDYYRFSARRLNSSSL